MSLAIIAGSPFPQSIGVIPSRPPVLHMQFLVADAIPDFPFRHTTSGAAELRGFGCLSSLRGQVYTDLGTAIWH